MSALLHYALWLAVALTAVAVAGAWVAKRSRMRQLRREKAGEMLDVLSRYAAWMALQRHALCRPSDSHETEVALGEACALAQGWFPELSDDMIELYRVHNRLADFLARHRARRMRSAGTTLESGHDTAFKLLWNDHRTAVQMMVTKLRVLAQCAAGTASEIPSPTIGTPGSGQRKAHQPARADG